MLMSVGDHRSHAVHVGEREFDKARNDPRFQAIVARGFDVSYDYDVPYLGGYSTDGLHIYIDKDTPEQITRGKRVYALRPSFEARRSAPSASGGLVRGIIVHEHWEKSVMLAWGFGYAEAHELATHAEHHFVREVLGMDSAEYEDVWRPVIRLAERKLGRKDLIRPPDFDITPYRETGVSDQDAGHFQRAAPLRGNALVSGKAEL
jgi:hypothetical protein